MEQGTVKGSDRLRDSVRKLNKARYVEPPTTGSEAETRQAIDALTKQVKFNRRLLLALGLAVAVQDYAVLIELLQSGIVW
jgi:hypothetical protein